jgi:hypothetical protein
MRVSSKFTIPKLGGAKLGFFLANQVMRLVKKIASSALISISKTAKVFSAHFSKSSAVRRFKNLVLLCLYLPLKIFYRLFPFLSSVRFK